MMTSDGTQPAVRGLRRVLVMAAAGFGLAAFTLSVRAWEIGPAAAQRAQWRLEFHEETFEDACALANEPALEFATVWHCQNNGDESYMVRLGPVEDRSQLDRIRQMYLERHRFSVIVTQDSCKTMERQSCPTTNNHRLRE